MEQIQDEDGGQRAEESLMEINEATRQACIVGPFRPQIPKTEAEMDISDRLFVILFFPSLFISLGIFFIGVGYLWSISIQNREMRKKA